MRVKVVHFHIDVSLKRLSDTRKWKEKWDSSLFCKRLERYLTNQWKYWKPDLQSMICYFYFGGAGSSTHSFTHSMQSRIYCCFAFFANCWCAQCWNDNVLYMKIFSPKMLHRLIFLETSFLMVCPIKCVWVSRDVILPKHSHLS